jgi:peptidoglycan/LPS O-acetylase OafA/YrhL
LLEAWRDGFVFSTGWFRVGHFWSLAVEEHFYLFWPVVVLLCSRRTLVGVCIGCMAAAFALRCGLVLGGWSVAAYVLSPCRMDSLALGGLLAVLTRGNGNVRRLSRWAAILTPLGMVLLAGIACWRHGLHPQDRVVQTAGYTLLALCAGGIILQAAGARATRPLGAAFNHPVLRFLGKYSYGMYVFHYLLYPVFLTVFPVDDLHVLTGSRLLAICLHVTAASGTTVLIALASWHLWERPFLGLKRHFECQPASGISPSNRQELVFQGR